MAQPEDSYPRTPFHTSHPAGYVPPEKHPRPV